jgi:hypothetical protein
VLFQLGNARAIERFNVLDRFAERLVNVVFI